MYRKELFSVYAPTQTAKAQEPWGKKPVFRGVFRIPEQHENILGATQKHHGLARRGERHERHADEHLIGGLVVELDLPTLHRPIFERWLFLILLGLGGGPW